MGPGNIGTFNVSIFKAPAESPDVKSRHDLTSCYGDAKFGSGGTDSLDVGILMQMLIFKEHLLVVKYL